MATLEMGQTAIRARPRGSPRPQARKPESFAPESFSFSPSSPLVLARVVEAEIIPRLLIAHKAACPAEANARDTALLEIEASAFAGRAIDQEAYALLGEVEDHIGRGVSVETLFLDLLAPAARQLGRWWEDDVCDFVDVTMGLWRLQEIVHELAARSPGAAEGTGGDRHVLFAVPPGEQHGFGSIMVEEFFRRAGWTTYSARTEGQDALMEQVGARWFEIIGLTVSCDSHIDDLADFITALRSASLNPETGILVGGRVFIEHPDLAEQVGADGTAPDARQAVLKAETFLEILACRARRFAGRV